MAIALRPWRRADIEPLAQLAGDPDVSRFMSSRFPHPYRLEDAKQQVEFCLGYTGRDQFFAVTEGGRLCGGANLGYFDGQRPGACGIGYWLGKPFWGRGLGSQVAELLCQRAFSDSEISCIEAYVVCENLGSIRILEHCGFTRFAVLPNASQRDGVQRDVARYRLRRTQGPNVETFSI